MNQGIRQLLILTVISIAIALLSGCPIHTKRVLIIGDSISLLSAGELTNVGNMVVDSDPSNRMNFTILANAGIGAHRTLGEPGDPDEYWPGIISNSIRPGSFDAVVVALATNDCVLLSSQGDYADAISRIARSIQAADPDVPIFWLTVPDYSNWPGCASIVNGDLGEIMQAGEYPNLKSFDYHTWAGAHRECFSDGIHPRERWHQDPNSGGTNIPAPAGYCEGQRMYAGWLKARLDEFFGPRL